MRMVQTKDGGVTIRLSKKQAEALHWALEGVGYDQRPAEELKSTLSVVLGSEGRIGGDADART